MTTQIPIAEIIIRLFLSIVFAAALGWERQARRKPAGLRTYMMVSLGAASFTIITLEFYQRALLTINHVPSDPFRIIQGIIGGIGFLGAGTIIQARGSVEGVTTAAGIWLMGAVGVASGSGYYAIAAIIVAFAFVVVSGVGILEKRIFYK